MGRRWGKTGKAKEREKARRSDGASWSFFFSFPSPLSLFFFFSVRVQVEVSRFFDACFRVGWPVAIASKQRRREQRALRVWLRRGEKEISKGIESKKNDDYMHSSFSFETSTPLLYALCCYQCRSNFAEAFETFALLR